ncbi:DUF4012 domain-containing protein [Sinomonas sp. P47F7]|uniref:DUF4012 domain-containing protein n=1 Tax=Sinomonas sp. P47F7 TaxID=3410987 RepID=UPI003BF5B7D8
MAKTVQSDIAQGRANQARDGAQRLSAHVDAARGFVSDPIWQVASLLPIVGTNFATTTQLAGILSDVVHRAVIPLSEVSANINPSALKPVGGALDIGPIAKVRPAVTQATGVLEDAYQKVALVRPGFGSMPQLQASVERLKSLLAQAAREASAADTATMVLPAMLGDSTPRTYLVLFQNNAELRATGGIPGAAAELRVDHGHITLGRQTAAKDFPRYPNPVLPLADQTKGLYGPITGQYFQDVNLVPQFPLTARLAAEMWKRQFGVQVDGVFSIDPIALGYLLQATGPVSLPTGETMDSSNAARMLLSDAYSKYHGANKDDFFSTAASAVFTKLANGSFQPKPMLDALGQAVKERRLLGWSSQRMEQDALQSAGISGDLPAQTPEHGVFGVYLNDATGAKMDYYLRESYRIGGAMCRSDDRQTWELEVTLTNVAPADAATSLPEYVTGGGEYGVKPGDVKTQVNVYAPASSIYTAAWKDSAPLDVHRDMDSGYPVAQTNVQLAPGQSTVLRFQFLGAPQAGQQPDLISTPTVNSLKFSKYSLSCDDVVR